MKTKAIPLQDSRGYFMLPQAPQKSGYYVYGTPGRGRGQYAHPGLLAAIFMVERQWAEISDVKFGIGNISLAGGSKFEPHKGHRTGLEVDVRAIRKDGKPSGVKYLDKQYDRDNTAKLIALFNALPNVDKIFFNDRSIPNCAARVKHDDHFHVQINVPG